MVDYRGSYKAKLDAIRGQIEARKAELREQGFYPGDRGRYRDGEGGDFTDQELVDLNNSAQDLQEILQREEARYSQFETTTAGHEQLISDSSPELIYLEDSQALPVDYGIQIEQFGELLWSKLHYKALIVMGLYLGNEFINTSNEGRIGAAVGGGIGVAGSLMNDGQIDSLETLAIGGLFWLGMKVGESLTPVETFLEKGWKSYDEQD
ncbi:hypothetical protein ACQ4M3_08965 [Leptolyngbya sp. AN03gr2]|uniref:hypothetical protein n=1 Tax=unclassified Leptolyngbya TaxID=2650499 RepID=UPI003D316C5B